MTDALSDEQKKLTRLWMEAFGDPQSDVDAFMNTLYKPENTVKIIKDGEIVSAAYLVDVGMSQETGEDLHGYYFCCAATYKAYRKMGYMSRIIEEIKKLAVSRGKDFIALIPANASLFDFYCKFGFREFFFCNIAEVKAVKQSGRYEFEMSDDPSLAGQFAQIQQRNCLANPFHIIKGPRIFKYTMTDARLSGYEMYFIHSDVRYAGYIIYDPGNNLIREAVAPKGELLSAVGEFAYYRGADRLRARLPALNSRGDKKGMLMTFGDNSIFENAGKRPFINHLMEE